LNELIRSAPSLIKITLMDLSVGIQVLIYRYMRG